MATLFEEIYTMEMEQSVELKEADRIFEEKLAEALELLEKELTREQYEKLLDGVYGEILVVKKQNYIRGFKMAVRLLIESLL